MTTTLNLKLTGLSCASCVGRVETALSQVEGIRDITVNLADKTLQLTAADQVSAGAALETLDAKGYPARRNLYRLTISGLSCASCVGRVTAILQDQPGVSEPSVNLAEHSARLSAADPTLAQNAATALTNRGYPAELVNEAAVQDTEDMSEMAELKRQTLIAAVLTLPVFVLEMGGHMVPSFHHFIAGSIGLQTSWLIQFLLTTVVLLGPGRVFLQRGLPALFRGAPDMNALVAMGTLSAWGFSSVATFAPILLPADSRHVYFEAAAMIVTLILLGRTLEARAKGRSGAAIQRLLGMRPDTAIVVLQGVDTEVPLAALNTGDILRIKPGARFPADGVVFEGESYVDESMLTGEPMPVRKSSGDPVTGGTVNAQGGLLVRATSVGSDSALSRIIEMVRQAQSSQPPIQSLINKITAWFVPAVLAIALLTFLFWLVLGPAPALNHALVAAVAVLIIACPCAMGLATPMSIMVGSGRAADLGVLFRKGVALQALGNVRVVAFDKTGTLTQGQPDLTEVYLAKGWNKTDVLQILASAEAGSEHPIAQAVLRAAGQTPLLATSDFAAVPGLGMQALVDGQRVLIGKARFLEQNGVNMDDATGLQATTAIAGQSTFYAAINDQFVARLVVSDPIKPTAEAAIKRLQEQGLDVALISGDSHEASAAVAQVLGISNVVSDVLPDGKVAALQDLRTRFGALAFVGDGINDAPALATADVGLAIGSGTDVAIEAADVVLMSGDPMGVADAIGLSRKTMGNIRQNLMWVFGYNILLIPAAALGLLSPALAAGAMAFSSVFVVSNALRLNLYGRTKTKDPISTSSQKNPIEAHS